MAPISRRVSSQESQEMMPVHRSGTIQDTDTDPLSDTLASVDVGEDDIFVSRWWLDVLFIFCGVSVFARTEAFFMQTDLFAECFGLGVDFYPIACGLAFVPGVLVTLLQNAYDISIDRKYGTRKAHLVRLVGAATLSVALIVGYFGMVTVKPKLRSSMFFIGPILVLIGVAASITWGSVTQITSCLPGKFQTYTFIGSMSTFGLYLPANVLLGDLCVVSNASAAPHNGTATPTFATATATATAIATATATLVDEIEIFGPIADQIVTAAAVVAGGGGGGRGGGDGGGDSGVSLGVGFGGFGNSSGGGGGSGELHYEARMSQVETFFAMCCILTILGCASIVAAMYTNGINRRLMKRDISLRRAANTPSSSDNIYEDEGEIAPLIQGGSVNSSIGGNTPLNDSAREQSLSQMQLGKIIWSQALSQFLVTVGTQLVVSQYVSIPARYYKSQTTFLLYEYYIGSALGMIAALSKRTHIGPKTLMVVSVLRFSVVPFTLLYIAHPDALGPVGSKHADILVQVINVVFSFTNGHLFSNTYSQANAMFYSPAGASRASSTLSVMYYLAISVAIGASILINLALCKHDPGGCHPKKNTTATFFLQSTGSSVHSGELVEVGVSGDGRSYPLLWDRNFGHFEF